MHIKDSPIKGYETDFARFELDADKIELHSSDKRNILLPYSGNLPDTLRDNDGAAISIGITVHLTVGVSLIVTKGKEKIRCLIAATPQEINDILFRLFFQYNSNNSYHTNWDCGLAYYYLGHYQSSYIHWRRFVVDGYGVDDLINQLSPKALDWLEKFIEYKKTA